MGLLILLLLCTAAAQAQVETLPLETVKRLALEHECTGHRACPGCVGDARVTRPPRVFAVGGRPALTAKGRPTGRPRPRTHL